MNRITTTSNFDFIQRNFIQAKKALIEEGKTGEVNVNRVKGIGLEGATRSGKSWDASAFVCHYITSYSGKQINICRDHLTTLKKTNYRTLKKVWAEFKLPLQYFNKSATEIHHNGNIITFVGINDDIMTAHGLESDLLWVNETMNVDKETLDQLEQRTTEFFMYDYNPNAVDSHLFDLEKRNDYSLFKTTIFDNKYAPLNSVQKVLSYAHPATDDWVVMKKYIDTTLYKFGITDQKSWELFKESNIIRQTADKYMWEVYGLGIRAVGEDIILSNWDTYTDEPQGHDWTGYGGDFGFMSDPSTLIRVTKDGNNLYLKECIWENGLLNNEIANKVKAGGWDDERSVWDSSEMKSVNELRSYGVPADWAEKGTNSVAYGIQRLQQFNLFIHKDSLHLQDEVKKYRWARDRQGNFKRNTYGKKIPVDKNNHGIDAVRYKVSYHFDILEQENEN